MPTLNMTDRWLNSRACRVQPPKKMRKRKAGRENAPTLQTTYHDKGMPGLILVVGTKTKTWRALYYEHRKPKTKKLGRYPHLKLAEAREEAREFLRNPQAARRRAASGTFKEVADKFIQHYVEPKRLRSKSEIERCLTKYVHPKWQDRQFLELQREDVTDLLDEIVERNGRRQADSVLAVVRKIMRWQATRISNYVPPVVPGMRRALTVKRDRFLDDNEIRALWKATDDLGTFGALVKVLLLTGQRREKIATMKRSDIADGAWTIPTEAREKGNAGTILLPQSVLNIVEAQPRIDDNDYVFASSHGRGCFNSFGQRKAELDDKLQDIMDEAGRKKLKDSPWVIHDLRRTARKLLTRAGIRPDVAELTLGHSIKGIQAVYDDVSEYRPMIEHALQRITDEVNKVVNPPPKGVVVALAGGRKQR